MSPGSFQNSLADIRVSRVTNKLKGIGGMTDGTSDSHIVTETEKEDNVSDAIEIHTNSQEGFQNFLDNVIPVVNDETVLKSA